MIMMEVEKGRYHKLRRGMIDWRITQLYDTTNTLKIMRVSQRTGEGAVGCFVLGNVDINDIHRCGGHSVRSIEELKIGATTLAPAGRFLDPFRVGSIDERLIFGLVSVPNRGESNNFGTYGRKALTAAAMRNTLEKQEEAIL